MNALHMLLGSQTGPESKPRGPP